MVALPPASAVTTPLLLTVAIAVLLLLHTPPPAASMKTTDVPVQRLDEPEILPTVGGVLTVIDFVAVAVVQLLVTE